MSTFRPLDFDEYEVGAEIGQHDDCPTHGGHAYGGPKVSTQKPDVLEKEG
jgi:hypothetical protein